MKSTGIRRKVDDLGRVVIPAGIRRSLGIREGDQVEVHVDGEHVVLAKPVDRCVFCQAEEDLQSFREKVVCRSCVASVGVLDESLRQQRTPAAGAPRHVQAVPDDARSSRPLPPWTDTTRPRPQPTTADQPSTPDSPRETERTTPSQPAASNGRPAEPAAESSPVRPAEPHRSADDEPTPQTERRYEPPASTAW